MSTILVTIAVLSDLHIVEDDPIQDKLLDKILNHFEQNVLRNKEIDFVIVSGDITSEGKRKQFKKANNFFTSLRLSLRIDSERFFFSPGNHDYNRDFLGTGFKYASNLSEDNFEDIYSSNDFKTHTKTVFSNFMEFQKDFYGKKHPLQGFFKIIEDEDYKINISVINSCLTNTIAQDSLGTFISPFLIDQVSSNKEEYDLSILIQHHPPHSLYPDNRKEIDRKLMNSYDLVIVGHEHNPDISFKKEINDTDGYILLISGSTYSPESDKYKSRFYIIDYDTDSTQGIISFFYADRKLDYCPKDTSIDYHARNTGEIQFELSWRSNLSSISSSPNPLELFTPSITLADTFRKYMSKLMQISSKKELIKLRSNIGLGSVNLNDLARYFLNYLLEKDFIQSKEVLIELLNVNIIFASIKMLKSRIFDFYDEDYFRKKKKSATDQVLRRRKDLRIIELQNQIAQKNIEIKDLRSRTYSLVELYDDRSVEFLPPLHVEEIKVNVEHLDWYKQLGFKKNPFPSKQGLENIGIQYYDDIIFFTKLIKDFQKLVLTDFESLLRISMCLYGPLGSGKTTLFEYVSKLIKIHHYDTVVVMFSLDGRNKVKEIKRRFFQKLAKELRKIHKELFEWVPTENDLELECSVLIENISTKKKNLFIFLEDIYKQSTMGEFIEEVISFISSLQIYRKDFSVDMNTTFIISAIDEVIQRIKGDRTTSGSIDDCQEISSINIEDALVMINRRLSAFSEKPEKPQVQITRKYLSSLVQMEKHSGLPVKTFRDYIDIVLKRFKRLEFTEDSITIRKNDSEIETVLIDLKTSHNEIYEAFLKLKERLNVNKDVFINFIKTLEYLWTNRQIKEESFEFSKHREYIIHLYTVNLLRKVSIDKKVGWSLSKSVERYFNKIKNIYHINPINIIPSLYYSELIKEEIEDEVSNTIGNIIKRGENYGALFLKELKNSVILYNEIFEFTQSFKLLENDSVKKFDIRKVKESFSSLITAFVIQCEEDVESYEEAIAIYEDSWFEDEEVVNFAKKIDDAIITHLTEERKITILSEYILVMKNIVSLLKRFVQWDNWFTLKGRKIWKSDKIQLNNIRRNIESGHFDIANKRIRSLLEIKLKKVIINYSRIIFGEKKWRRGIPEDKNRILSEYETVIPLPYKEKSDILSNLDLEDFYDIMDFLTVEKMENKLEFLNELNFKLVNIKTNLQKSSLGFNPWNSVILEVVEICDNFLLNLLRGDIPCPWNSSVFLSREKIKQINQKDLQSLEKLLPEIILLDKSLMVKSYIQTRFELIDLIFTVSSKKSHYQILPDYKKEEITIKTKNSI